jgi:hypothetical protein
VVALSVRRMSEKSLTSRRWFQHTLSIAASLCIPFVLQTVVIVIGARADSPFPDGAPLIAIYLWIAVGFSCLFPGFKRRPIRVDPD